MYFLIKSLDEEIILKALIKKGAVSMTWDIIGITE